MDDLEHELAVLRPRPGDVLVLYLEQELSGVRSRQLRDMMRWGRVMGQLPEPVGFLVFAGENARLECVSEDEMARAGWRRA